MEDTKKSDNIVKIFMESLKESKDFSDQKIEQIAKGIVQVLASLHDPSKKEFRDKVNIFKMKLKGSRNESARQALLSDKITAIDFINLPQESQNQEYFDSLVQGGESKANSNNIQNPPPRANQMVANQVRGTAPIPRGASRPGGVRAMPPQTNNFRPPVQQQIPKQPQEQAEREQNSNLISNSPQNQEPVQYQIEVEQKIKEFTLDKTSDQKSNVSQSNNFQNTPPPQFEDSSSKTAIQSQEKTIQVSQQKEKQKDEKLNQQEVVQNVVEQQNSQAPPIPRIPPSIRNQPPVNHTRIKQQIPQQRKTQQDEIQPNLQTNLPPQENFVQDHHGLNKNQIERQDDKSQVQAIPVQKANKNLTPPIQTEKQEINQQQKQSQQSQIPQSELDQQIKKKENEQANTSSSIAQQKNTLPMNKAPVQQVNNQQAKQQQLPPNNVSQPTSTNQQNLQTQINNQTRQQQQQQKNNDQKQVIPSQQQGQNQFQNQKQSNARIQQQNLVKQPADQTEGDQEGECEDAHISQIKSHIDEFKKIKQQFREQHNAIDNEQILANLSNEYSYYDDDESYDNDEDSNSQQNKKNILQNLSPNKGHEDDLKSNVQQNQQQQLSKQTQQIPQSQQPKHQQNVENKRSDSKNQKEKHKNQYYDADYELHQQIENQKLQEELQRKQMIQMAANQQTHNLAPESNFTASQSSKQVQSKQKLDEMSDFEKIEINPSLRNQDFEENYNDDQIHILHQQKVTNLGENHIKLTNAFDIAVHQAHEKLSSDIALNQLDQESNNGKSSKNPSHHNIENNQKQQQQPQREEVNNQVEEEVDDNQSDNFQNILQGLNGQSRNGSGDEQQDKQDIQEDFIQEGRENLFETDTNNAEIQIPANFSQSSPDQKQLKSKSRNTSQSSFTYKNQRDQEQVKKNSYSGQKIKNKQIFKDEIDGNINSDNLNAQQNQEDYDEDDLLEFSSTENQRLKQENKQLKAKLHQVLQEWQKNEEISKKNLINKEKKNELLQKQVKETQDEITLIKQYLDQIIEENSKYKQQYEEMKLLFGQNENLLREDLSQLKQKVKSEYTNEIQQLRSVNVAITQNNQYLQTALDSLAVDLEQKDLIIQKLTQQSSEQVNRSYQNINSKSLNYSYTNNQPHQQQQQVSQQQPKQSNSNIQQQNISQVNNQIKQFETYDRIDTQEQEELYGDGIGINVEQEFQVNQQQNQDTDNNNYDQQNKEEEHQQNEHINLMQNYDQKHNEENQHSNHVYINQQHELQHQDSEKPLEYLINQQYTTQSSPEYQHKYKNEQEYVHQSPNQNQELQEDDAERFFDQLQDGDKQAPKIQQAPVVENKKNTTPNVVSQNPPIKNNNIQSIKSLKAAKKDSLQEQLIGVFGEDDPQSHIHNQSHSNFFDLNSIPNMPTTSDIKSTQNAKRMNQRQKNTLDFNQAENTFFSTENDFFNTVVSDKFNTSNISAIHNPFNHNNNNNFFNTNFNNPFIEPQQSKNTNQGTASKKKARNTGAGNLFN